jgi:hypothetical protein
MRRELLRRAHSSYDSLTATGRYKVADMIGGRGFTSTQSTRN